MGHNFFCFLLTVLVSISLPAHGCVIDGVDSWLVSQNQVILDTFSGNIWNRTTLNITSISSTTHGEGLNGGPYVNINLVDSRLIISTNDAYANYEEVETTQRMSFTTIFRCRDGANRPLVFLIDVTDTNNNNPVFKQSDGYEFTIAPPLPPGFLISNCGNDIIVRDIDLTTERIDYVITGSTLFQIAYDDSSTVAKEFKAALTTTSFIRTIPEPIILTITATDVDRTGDPRRTSTTTIKILADTEFEFPDEPIFSQTFYLADYTTEHDFVLQDTIYLTQGYDDQVVFSFEGQHSEYFDLVTDGNQLSFNVKSQLPISLYSEGPIFLVVKAERQYTSGATATVVLQLPEARELSFEKLVYKGSLEDNVIALETIVLNVGYDSDVIFELTGDEAGYFDANNVNNEVTLGVKEQLPESVLENNFVVLILSASGTNAVATSVTILLEIEKQAIVTPVFSQFIYQGTYVNSTNITFETISLSQGNDDTVTFNLDGDHAQYFTINSAGNSVMLTLKSAIPEDLIFNEKVLVFNIKAEKSGTSGANAAVSLSFPRELTEPTVLKFTYNTYNGLLNDDTLTLGDIVLESGFTTDIKFSLTGEYSDDFTISNNDNVVTIKLSDSASLEDLMQNGFIILELEATRERSVPVTSTVIIEVPETHIVLPVFQKPFYTGTYTIQSGLEFTETMALQLGFDDTVTFELEGDSAQWFSSSQDGNSVSLASNVNNQLPDEVFAENDHLIFTVVANKPNTIGGRAAISISLIKDSDSATFDKVLYNGNIKDGVVSHETIIISDFTGSNIVISGELATSFEASLADGYVTVQAVTSAVFPDNLTFIALTLQADSAKSVLIIDVESGGDDETNASFSRVLYNGNLKAGVVSHETIVISGFTGTNIVISGELATSFEATLADGYVTVQAVTSAVFPDNLSFVALILQADNAKTVLMLDVTDSDSDSVSFGKVLYNGNITDGMVSHETIGISGFTGSNIVISGELATSFEATLADGYVTVQAVTSAVFPDNLSFIALTLQADSAKTVLMLDITDSDSDSTSFGKVLYNGNLKAGVVSHETITVSEFTGSNIVISGELATSFEATLADGYVTVQAVTSAVFPDNLAFIALTLQADSAKSVLIIDVESGGDDETNASFSRVLYNGNLKAGVVSHETIVISGFTGTNIVISGELATSFEATLADGYVTVQAVTSAVFPDNLSFVALILQADNAKTVLMLDVTDSDSDSVSFGKVLYNGNITDGVVSHETIGISGFTGSNIIISGELATSFEATLADGYVTVQAVASAVFPDNLSFIALTLQADSAKTVLMLDITDSDSDSTSFGKVLYNGNLKAGVVSHETITVSEFTGSSIVISGELATSFEATLADGYVTVQAVTSAVFPDNLAFIALTLQADSARSVLIIDVESESDSSVSFDKVLYNGNLKDGVVTHDTIGISEFTGSNVIISGEYAESFEANLANGNVVVQAITSAVFPENLSFIVLTLRAGSAQAVLLLDVTSTVDPDLPTVSFDPSSYFLWADVNQTGVLGQVQATVTNDEAVVYSLLIDDDYLQERVSITTKGEIEVTATVNKGVYNFKVTATTETSHVSATAPVLLRVDDLPECATEDGLPPLIILERIEEEPHLNLVVLNQTKYKDCQYTLTSLWPEDQSWLYVDNDGLHAKAIDREHESIAFMILSQIQVELILHCDNDEDSAIVKRSLTAETGSELDTSNYGSNKWILADTITYNARRSIVNLIVEDINDNPPIFAGKENEPIYVGYPISELENTILPRALIELKATDADIGENAAIVYWSMEDNLAIAPTTGFVHVRNNSLLENNSSFTFYAIDQNGSGLNGSLDIVVKLLARNQIAVVTVQNAFLDDENSIVSNLSTSVGYDIKVLRGGIISVDDEEISRRKREITSTTGASLQLFVYGMSGSQPIDVYQLTSDLDQVVLVNKVQVMSLEDHLNSLNTCPVQQCTALLATTITLAVLLLILIVAATVWFILKWRRKQNYEQFSDASSLATPSEVDSKVDVVSKPKLDIEELKRSERRLQELLDAPIPEVIVQPPIKATSQIDDLSSNYVNPQETIIDVATIPQSPIVIQSIDKLKDDVDESTEDDEFGEDNKNIITRKSVVTFNENVEKIIHVEYEIEDSPDPNSEVYKF